MNIKNKKDEIINFVMYASDDVDHFIIAIFITGMQARKNSNVCYTLDKGVKKCG